MFQTPNNLAQSVPTLQELLIETLSERISPDYSENENSDAARALIATGWRNTYAELFGQSFVDVLADHHIASIEWHWHSRLAILEHQKEVESLKQLFNDGEISEEVFEKLKKEARKFLPQYYADFPKFSRGHMKSTLAKRIAVADAFVSYAYGVGGYCLYFSGTDDKTSKHALSISQLLQSKPIQKYAPALARVKRAEEGNRALGWKTTFFYTDAGYVFHFGSLQSGLAGGNVDDLRPTLMIPDDIDDRKDSPAIAERNTKAFTLEILPMGKTGTLTFFAQNLISRFSVMYRIHKGQLKVLTNRRPSEPVPAVIDLQITYRTVNGISTPFITNGTPTWAKGMPIEACEEELQRIGESSFRSECQHEVEQSRVGLVHKRYDDNVHPISYSQTAAVFGSRDFWKEFYKVPFSDWARTKTKFHANVAGYLAVSSQSSVLPGHTFIVPMSFRAEASPEDVAVRLLSALTPHAYSNRRWEDLVDEAWKRMNAETHFNSVNERLDYAKNFYSSLIPKYSRPILTRFNVGTGANSHSEDKVRQMLNHCFGFAFIPSNPTETAALEDIDEAMRVDYSMPHLFDSSKIGYTRFHVLCADDTSKEPQIINGIEVYPPIPYPEALEPDELHDESLFRYQMCERRYADPDLTKTGEKIDVLLKLNDDFGQALQMIYFKRLLANIPLTKEQRKEEHLGPTLRVETLSQMPDSEEKDGLLQRRRIEEEKINRQMNKPVRSAAMNRFSRR